MMWEYFEEYRKCGCVSAVVDDIKDLPGYCPVHGTDALMIHKCNKLRKINDATTT